MPIISESINEQKKKNLKLICFDYLILKSNFIPTFIKSESDEAFTRLGGAFDELWIFVNDFIGSLNTLRV